MRVVAMCVAIAITVPVGGIAARHQAITLPASALQNGAGDNPPPEVVDCSWGEIKLCLAGHCVEACCPQNCKPEAP